MQIEQGKYTIQGLDVQDLCGEYGTPLYVYDTSIMHKQYKRLKKAFPNTNTSIHFACKALSNINVVKYLKTLGAGLDTVSIQEVQIGLRAGFDPKDIIFTPNCVSLEEINKAVDMGVRINIDNISILEQFGHEYGSKVPVGVRVNPHIMAGGNSKISVGHIDSKFGISMYQLSHVKNVVAANDMKVEGLHMHTGSDILDIDVFLRGAEILFDAAMDFPDLKYLDFGSGFKVSYKEGDISTDIEELGEMLGSRFNEFCEKTGRELQLIFEPGKYLTSESGTFFTKVNVIKQTTSTVFAGVDSGMNHLIRPMLYDAYHHIVNVSNPEGKPRIYAVVGYICETDTFGWNRKISEIKEGDLLAFQNAGAYCFSMASNYNSRFRPAEVLVHNGEAHLIREREDMEDILRKQKELDLFKEVVQ